MALAKKETVLGDNEFEKMRELLRVWGVGTALASVSTQHTLSQGTLDRRDLHVHRSRP